jgi:hypothetical protein
LRIEEESTSSSEVGSVVKSLFGFGRMQFYDQMVVAYTKKALTFPSDILRALSGALHQFYGSRTSFGLPWGDFDRGLLWQRSHRKVERIGPDVTTPLPSWSWTSSLGWKQFSFDSGTRPLALAYWGKVLNSNIDHLCPSLEPQVDVARPVKADLNKFNVVSASASPRNSHNYIVAGLAWDGSCLSKGVPKEMCVDCSREEYTRRLEQRWPDYTSYWLDTVGSHQPSQIFTKSDIKLGNLPGRLMVRTQKARFVVCLNTAFEEVPQDFNPKEWIRDDTGRFVGRLHYDQNNGVRQSEQGKESADFILLSTVTTPESLQSSLIPHDVRQKRLCDELFACPCLQVKPGGNESSETSQAGTDFEHFVECSRHADFLKPSSEETEAASCSDHAVKDDLGRRQFAKHFEHVSYFDSEGKMMHAWDKVPALNVLMIRPSIGQGKGTGVYQRVGIGVIYLKRWVEANPVFETMVLE